MTQHRFERLGVNPEWVDAEKGVRSIQDSLKIRETQPGGYSVRSTLVDRSVYAACRYYYRDDLESARYWAKRALEYADDYFFGPWQEIAPTGDFGKEPPNRAWWRRNLTWKEEWEGCLVLGSALGDWSSVEKLAAYFHADVGGNVDQSVANRNWHLLVAGVLAGRPEEEFIPYREAIARGKGREKREQLLLAFLDAIRSGSDADLAAASSEYFKHYKKTDAKKKEVLTPLMFDGSFLVHFATKEGRTVLIPDNIQDHLIAL